MVVPWRLHFHPNTDSFYCTYLAGQDPLTEQVSPRRWVCVDGWFNLCAFTLSVQCALIARCTTESIQCDSGQVGGHTHTHTHTHRHTHTQTHTVILFLTFVFVLFLARCVNSEKDSRNNIHFENEGRTNQIGRRLPEWLSLDRGWTQKGLSHHRPIA